MVKLAVVRANGKYPGNTPAVAGPPTHISSSVAELGGLDLTGKAAVLKTGLAMRGRFCFRRLPHEEAPFAIIRNHPPAQPAAQKTDNRLRERSPACGLLGYTLVSTWEGIGARPHHRTTSTMRLRVGFLRSRWWRGSVDSRSIAVSSPTAV